MKTDKNNAKVTARVVVQSLNTPSDIHWQQLVAAKHILEQVVFAWRHGEFGNTEAGILGAPTYVCAAVLLLDEMKGDR